MFDLVTTTLEIDTVTKSYSWILLGRGLIGQVKRFRNLLHFYWLWALLIVPQGCWIDTFWLVHLSRRGSLLRCLNPVKEKFRFLNFFSFFLNWPMKNFYFFIFKKSRDLTGRLHSSLFIWRFVGKRLFLARVRTWLLFACLRAIARMIARIFLLNILGKYLLGVGFCSCVFCFVFYLVTTKLVLLIFSAFFTAKKCTC